MFFLGISVISALVAAATYIFSNLVISIPIAFAASFIGLIFLWAVVGAIASLFVDISKECKKSEWIFQFYAFCIIDIVTHLLRIRFHVSGSEILPDRNFLLVGNHRSAIDPILEMGVLRKYNLGFVAKKELFEIPVIGKIMHKRFCLSLDRENLRSELQTIINAINVIKSGAASIGIYPEGTRNPSDTLLQFKAGAFKIAQKAECPIVIAVIRNFELVQRNAPFRKTEVYLDFIGVLDVDYVKQHSCIKISDDVKEMIEKALKNRHGQLEQHFQR